MLAVLLALPLSAMAYYANGTVSNEPALTKPASSSADLTTYVTVHEGKTITVTTHKPKTSQTPAVAPTQAAAVPSSSQDLTTYVTVLQGKTITVTTQKPKAPTTTGVQLIAPASASADLTTYVTVELGKTLTITTQKAQQTGVILVNNAPAVVPGIAALAGAGAAALLL